MNISRFHQHTEAFVLTETTERVAIWFYLNTHIRAFFVIALSESRLITGEVLGNKPRGILLQ